MAKLESKERQKQTDRDAHFEELRLKHEQEIEPEKNAIVAEKRNNQKLKTIPVTWW